MSLFIRFKGIPSLVNNVTPNRIGHYTPSRFVTNKKKPITATKIKEKQDELLADESQASELMNFESLKKELLEEMEKQGITEQSEIDLEVAKLEEVFNRVQRQQKESVVIARKAKNNPLVHAYEKELNEELARANLEFAKMGPITQHTVQMLAEARARISEDLKQKYLNSEGDALKRIMDAVGELDRANGRLPQKRVNITPEEFEHKYMFAPKDGELSLKEVLAAEEKLKKFHEKQSKKNK